MVAPSGAGQCKRALAAGLKGPLQDQCSGVGKPWRAKMASKLKRIEGELAENRARREEEPENQQEGSNVKGEYGVRTGKKQEKWKKMTGMRAGVRAAVSE